MARRSSERRAAVTAPSTARTGPRPASMRRAPAPAALWQPAALQSCGCCRRSSAAACGPAAALVGVARHCAAPSRQGSSRLQPEPPEPSPPDARPPRSSLEHEGLASPARRAWRRRSARAGARRAGGQWRRLPRRVRCRRPVRRLSYDPFFPPRSPPSARPLQRGRLAALWPPDAAPCRRAVQGEIGVGVSSSSRMARPELALLLEQAARQRRREMHRPVVQNAQAQRAV